MLDYLGRYTHRVALSNERLLDVSNGQVTFQWKDYRSKHKQKSRVMTLSSDQFIRRFLMHILPRGFQRIRFFGFLSNRNRKVQLALCRQFIAPLADLLPIPAGDPDSRQDPAPESIWRCPACGQGEMRRVLMLAPQPRPLDSS